MIDVFVKQSEPIVGSHGCVTSRIKPRWVAARAGWYASGTRLNARSNGAVGQPAVHTPTEQLIGGPAREAVALSERLSRPRRQRLRNSLAAALEGDATLPPIFYLAA